jgi:hypothetical protein
MAFYSPLILAGFWAAISALFLIGAVYEGAERASRGWVASFVGSSFAAAYCFRRLL